MVNLIYITGDLHGSIDKSKLNTKRFPEQKLLTKSDYVIITGDFGNVWNNSKEEKWMLKWLAEKNFTTLFIDGNHENFNLLNSYPVSIWNGGRVHKINDSVYHLMRGQIFNIDEIKVFTFGGAMSTDQEDRKLNISWWPEEVPSTQEFNEAMYNLKMHSMEVNLVLTHAAPTDIVNQLFRERNNDPTCAMLDVFRSQLNYDHWFCGHIHQDYCIEDNFTVVYNKMIKYK